MRAKVGAASIAVERGDITDWDVDAIVNAANATLTMSAGVAAAIKRKGGVLIEEEAIRQGPVEVGEAVLTPGGNLLATHVIHAAAMGYRAEDRAVPKKPGTASSAEIIRNATQNSLRRAEELKFRSIAFPALATGVAGFPVDECAEVMIGAAREYAAAHPSSSIELAVFVLFTERDYEIFKRVADKAEESFTS